MKAVKGMRREACNLIVLDTEHGQYRFHADVEADDEGNRVPVLRLTVEPAESEPIGIDA